MPETLPSWTDSAGGSDRWLKWRNSQATRCHARAQLWATKTKWRKPLPSKADWTRNITEAIRTCDGKGAYSGFPLSLELTPKGTHPMWPSVDHVHNPATADVVLETRVVNDMKTIMNREEFKLVIGHLAAKMSVEATLLGDSWFPKRGYWKEQPEDEPPLPEVPKEAT